VPVLELLKEPFSQVTLPLMVTVGLTTWYKTRRLGNRIDDFRAEMNLRFDEIDHRFDEIERRFVAIDRRAGRHSPDPCNRLQ
jgi:hypothetical protein